MFATIMAERLMTETDVTEVSDEDNPYYQNLCGMYSVFDSPMYVTAVETGEQVLFDLQLKEDYPKTAELYTVVSDEYETLCQKYPDQVGLIKCIIHPAADLTTVIAAEDFTLLAYDNTYLKSNERESLVQTVRRILSYIQYRWYIADYAYEDMYPAAFAGIVYAFLTQALIAQRAANLRTSQVHQMHIWEYLISRGLKDYQDILTDKQSLFLYRNIEYLLQNKGKKSTLEILASNLLADLQVSLVGRTILQQTIDGFDDCVTIPEFLPEDVVRLSANEQYQESEAESMAKILSRVAAEGYYPNLTTEVQDYMKGRFGETELNVLPTRLLELKKHVIYKPFEALLVRFLFDSFVSYLAEGHLNYRISFTDPNINMAVDLSLQEAVALFQYAHFKGLGESIETIPIAYYTTTCYKKVKPTWASLPKTITLEDSSYLMTSIVDVKTAWNEIYFDNKFYTSTADFEEMLAKQFAALVKHINSLRTSGNMLYHKAFGYLYESFLDPQEIVLDLVDAPNYTSWFAQNKNVRQIVNTYNNLAESQQYWMLLRDLLIDKMIPTDNDLFRDYTSFNQDKSLLYNGLKKLFIQLCSYRLTFLETDRDKITFITNRHIVCGDIGSTDKDYSRLDLPGPGIISKASETNTINLMIVDGPHVIDAYDHIQDTTQMNTGPNLAVETHITDFTFRDDLINVKDIQQAETVTTTILFGSRIYQSVEAS